MQPVKIGIIGVSGFGASHVESIAACEEQGVAELSAAVIRAPETRQEKREQEEKLRARGVRIYRDYHQMLEKEKGTIDLVAIPSGIGTHAKLSTEILRAGYHVVCEKPVAGSVEEAFQMAAAQKETGRVLAIGYQNIFSPSIQRLKQLRLEERLGRPLAAKCYALWPRSSTYYQRNYWAGRIAVEGTPIYDSPAQNAVAHYLNNLLYIAGDTQEASAEPENVYAENYRAQKIESADTQYIHATTGNGLTIQFIATHAVDVGDGPVACYRFENGYVDWLLADHQGKTRIYEYGGDHKEAGLVEEFDNGGVDPFQEVFRDTCRAIREGREPLNSIHNSWQHTLCIRAAFAASDGVHSVPGKYKEDLVQTTELPDGGEAKAINTVIPGVSDMVRRMHEEEKGFANSGAPWAVRGRTINAQEVLP